MENTFKPTTFFPRYITKTLIGGRYRYSPTIDSITYLPLLAMVLLYICMGGNLNSSVKQNQIEPSYDLGNSFVSYADLSQAGESEMLFQNQSAKRNQATINLKTEKNVLGFMLLITLTMLMYRNNRLQAETNRQIIIENRSLNKALSERETLLKEIHHRVKNNMQIVASLLCLQSNKIEDESLKKILEDGQSRVRSMVLIHQKLYENEDFKHVPFKQYLTELTTEVKSAFSPQMDHVVLEVLSTDVYFEVKTSVPLGLIVTELTTNAFKHAFHGTSHPPKLLVNLTQSTKDNYTLTISDNGVGFTQVQNSTFSSSSFGLNLIRIMSEQLGGQYQIMNNEGTNFTLHFKV